MELASTKTLSIGYVSRRTSLLIKLAQYPFKAWSIIIRTLVPNVDVLTNDLDIFTQDCGAVESAIFEKNTFLLVARSSVADISVEGGALFATNGPQAEAQIVEAPKPGEVGLSNKFEVISKLMKAFKNDLKKHSGEPFEALRMRTADFTLVLDELTQTSYIVVITSADTRTSKLFYKLKLFECS